MAFDLLDTYTDCTLFLQIHHICEMYVCEIFINEMVFSLWHSYNFGYLFQCHFESAYTCVRARTRV